MPPALDSRHASQLTSFPGAGLRPACARARQLRADPPGERGKGTKSAVTMTQSQDGTPRSGPVLALRILTLRVARGVACGATICTRAASGGGCWGGTAVVPSVDAARTRSRSYASVTFVPAQVPCGVDLRAARKLGADSPEGKGKGNEVNNYDTPLRADDRAAQLLSVDRKQIARDDDHGVRDRTPEPFVCVSP